MKTFGLIGKDLAHSFSPSYFAKKFEELGLSDCEYQAFPLPDISGFEEVKKLPNLQGLNVTIPYKESIIPYLDEISSEAKVIGAVNTIVKKGNHFVGHNTDHIGFAKSLAPFLEPGDQKAVILGTGGASKAIAYALEQKGIIYKFVSRNPSQDQLPYSALGQVLPYVDIIVNTTPLGTHPNTQEHPEVPFDAISNKHFVIDLIYNPSETLLLQRAKSSGARTLNGLSMLHIQAEESWKLWNNS